MQNIDKRFGGVHALKSFSFECFPGEVHVLMGENGAGKSTLLNILGGIHQADSGQILLKGEPVQIRNPIDAREKGVAIIHQELSMCRNMTVAENIYRGMEPVTRLHFVDYDKMYDDAQAIIDSMDLNLDPYAQVSTLSIAEQQMVEIVSALSKNADIVVMDEPTASLTEKEVDALFRIVAKLKADQATIIYVSHRMNETFSIGDRVTVMRDGNYIGTRKVSETSVDELVQMMVGRSIDAAYGTRVFTGTDDVVMSVRNFNNYKLNNVSFDLKKGEILGFSGLVGAGRTELSRAIFGLDKIESGELIVEGRTVKVTRPKDAIKLKIGLVPEDRKGAGLILSDTVAFNLTLAVLKQFLNGIIYNRKKEEAIVDEYQSVLHIRMRDSEQLCRELSGGNQQKVVLSKWLATEPHILILDEPTRGIDVGAKAEIYELMNRLAAQGISIMFISSDLPEIINISHRVVVMCEGEITGILDARETELTQEAIMSLSIKGGSSHALNS